LVDIDEHLFQQPEFIEETSKRVRALVYIGEHLFQQLEFIEETSKQARALVDKGEHHFQQSEFKDNQKNENITYENLLPGQRRSNILRNRWSR
jgi:hypothetical protein